jgi:hypothetical protein
VRGWLTKPEVFIPAGALNPSPDSMHTPRMAAHRHAVLTKTLLKRVQGLPDLLGFQGRDGVKDVDGSQEVLPRTEEPAEPGQRPAVLVPLASLASDRDRALEPLARLICEPGLGVELTQSVEAVARARACPP